MKIYNMKIYNMKIYNMKICNTNIYVITVLVPYSPSAVPQSLVVLQDDLLEAEVGMEGDIVLQVGGGEHVPIQYEGLTGHELHKPFAEMPYQPLLQ